MKKHYPWLWFDADGTLFDFKRAEELALQRVFELIGAPYVEAHLARYQRLNQQLWLDLERQAITPEVLQVRRFELLLAELQLTGAPAQLSAAYLEQLALCADLLAGAEEVVRRLHATCRIAIVTNGLRAVQHSRLARSAIHDCVSALIISEEVGAAKPKAAFFDAALARASQPAKRDILMIGDSLSADIRGGLDYGLDTCWYNPSGEARPGGWPITYEIAQLAELLEILE